MRRMMEDEKQALITRVLDALASQGLYWDGHRLQFNGVNKDALRAVHAKACEYKIDKAKDGLHRHEDKLLQWIANGDEIDPDSIAPTLVEVLPGSTEELLFRYARLHWSIPVSSGYGRRLRFLIWDEAHDRLIGILGLCDPVFALAARDHWVGWTKEQRRLRLVNVMDAFVLGAVPPYSQLLGGKLVALAAVSNEIRDAFSRRYSHRKTRMSQKVCGPLAMITTTSALGRSSIYNRVRFRDRLLLHSVGFTSGYGDFPYMNGVYEELMELVSRVCVPTAKRPEWGSGFRNRREVLLKALKLLGLPQNLIYHGIGREIFVAPLAENAQAFLRCETEELQPLDLPFRELAEWWKQRWALPRATRDERFRSFRRETWRLWN
jgi:hypothetical protein